MRHAPRGSFPGAVMWCQQASQTQDLDLLQQSEVAHDARLQLAMAATTGAGVKEASQAKAFARVTQIYDGQALRTSTTTCIIHCLHFDASINTAHINGTLLSSTGTPMLPDRLENSYKTSLPQRDAPADN